MAESRFTDPPQQDTDFFVSYASSDKEDAEWIAWQLKEAGHTLIFQAWDMPPGSVFTGEMRKGLERCHRILAWFLLNTSNRRIA